MPIFLNIFWAVFFCRIWGTLPYHVEVSGVGLVGDGHDARHGLLLQPLRLLDDPPGQSRLPMVGHEQVQAAAKVVQSISAIFAFADDA